MNQNPCVSAPAVMCEEGPQGVQDILTVAQNQLNDCEGLVGRLLTFITGKENKAADPRNTDCMVSQAVNIRDQAENVHDGLCLVFDTLGVK